MESEAAEEERAAIFLAQGNGKPVLGLHTDIGGKGDNTKRDKSGGQGKGLGQEDTQGGKTNKDGHYKRHPDVERVHDLRDKIIRDGGSRDKGEGGGNPRGRGRS